MKNSRKIYFYDNGVLNTLLSNYLPVRQRTDAGSLWENFLVSERIKRNAYAGHWCNRYFWRTHKQKEIDYIEEFDGRLHAYEFKYNPRKQAVAPKDFAVVYPDADFTEITPANFDAFVMP